MPDVRVTLSDRAVSKLPFAKDGQYLVHDEKLKGFYLLVGKKRCRYMIKGDLRIEGKRAATVKVSVGDAAEVSAAKARTIAMGYLADLRQGRHPKPEDVRQDSVVGEVVAETVAIVAAPLGPTLKEAWLAYKAALIKKERADKTIKEYGDHIEHTLVDLLKIASGLFAVAFGVIKISAGGEQFAIR